jgi:hypothetical protein
LIRDPAFFRPCRRTRTAIEAPPAAGPEARTPFCRVMPAKAGIQFFLPPRPGRSGCQPSLA